MENIPKDIEKYLVKDEFIEERFDLKGCVVCASSRRLFIKKGNIVRDVDYSHISSIEYRSKRNWIMLIFGILIAGISFIIKEISDFWWALLIIGFMIFLFGLIKKEDVELAVVGLSNPLKLSGQRSELDSLFKLIREKRV